MATTAPMTAAEAPPLVFPPGGILDIANTITPNDFEEKLATDVSTCASTGRKVTISYQTFGNPTDPMLLLVPGLGCQGLSIYDTATCTWYARQGYYVVRMDNRDVGLSTKFDDVPQRLIMPYFMLPSWMAFGERVPYTLNDMADDAAAMIRLLAPEGNKKAHIIGVSMGGMIAQCVALRNPELVLSLTLIMTNSGNAKVGPTPISTLIGFLYQPKSDSIEDVWAHNVWFFKTYLLGAPSSSEVILKLTEKEYIRTGYRKGALRQMGAISRAPCRDAELSKLANIPTHIVHGERDYLLPVANGRHLHKMIPNAKLTTFPLMGHFMDDDHAQPMNDAILAFLREVKM